MDFDSRLQRAIQRGEKVKDAKGRAERQEKLTIEELRTMHSGYRLEVSEHVESCLKKLADHVPGFEYQTIANEDGWGARLSRDDLHLKPGKSAENRYSRFEMLIPPFTDSAILELTVKGTVRNREVLNRKHYQKVGDIDVDSFKEMIDLRVLEFAEVYAATDK